MPGSPTFFLRAMYPLILLLSLPFTVSAEACAEYMWHGIYTMATKPGAWRVGWHGDDWKNKRYFGDEDQRGKLWRHTVEVVDGAVGHTTES